MIKNSTSNNNPYFSIQHFGSLPAVILLFTIVYMFNYTIVIAQSTLPNFKDYSINEKIYNGLTAPLVLTRDDLMFKTRLKWATKNIKPNFAGHYILTTWGCGAQCLMGAVIDAKTGKVYWIEFSICCWWSSSLDDEIQPIEFRPESRMIVFTGFRNEKDGDNGTHYYQFVNEQFVHIRSVIKPEK